MHFSSPLLPPSNDTVYCLIDKFYQNKTNRWQNIPLNKRDSNIYNYIHHFVSFIIENNFNNYILYIKSDINL